MDNEYLQTVINTLNRQYDHLREDLKGMVLELKSDFRSGLSERDQDITELQKKVETIEQWKWKASGFFLAVQVVIAYLIDYLKK